MISNTNSNINNYRLKIKLFISKVMESFTVLDIINELALVRPGSDTFAIALLESFDLNEYGGDILERICCLWGSKLFIFQGIYVCL